MYFFGAACYRCVSLQAWAPVGMHKYHSFMEYVQLYPEYDFIFLGDNGQGDAMCADRVIEKSGNPAEPPYPAAE